jgi:hypothetical protein
MWLSKIHTNSTGGPSELGSSSGLKVSVACLQELDPNLIQMDHT